MKYSLDSISIQPPKPNPPKNIVILCHGYGGDGRDISIMANYWKNFLPETLFLCPNAPEICKFLDKDLIPYIKPVLYRQQDLLMDINQCVFFILLQKLMLTGQ